MKIRKAKKEDLGEIIELWKKYEEFEDSITNLVKNPFVKKRKNAEQNMKANFSRVIKSNKADILIAEQDKKIKGFILISKSQHDDIHDFKYYGGIHYLYVLPEYRGGGIASALWKESKKWFRQRNIKYLNLNVNINNKKGRKIYKKWGFNDYELGMWNVLR